MEEGALFARGEYFQFIDSDNIFMIYLERHIIQPKVKILI